MYHILLLGMIVTVVSDLGGHYVLVILLRSVVLCLDDPIVNIESLRIWKVAHRIRIHQSMRHVDLRLYLELRTDHLRLSHHY